jgi:PAS domain S-box-containing protein
MSYTASSIHKQAPLHEHVVQFYDRDDFLLEEVSGFLGAGLQDGQAGVVIATAQHRAGLEQRLAARRLAGFPHDRYIALDAAATLSKFMVNGWPDEQLFAQVIGSVIQQVAQNGQRPVRAFGEMVSLLWAEGRHEAAFRLEELWNDLAASHSFSLLCAYPMAGFHDQEHSSTFLHICNAHSQVRPAESFAGPADPDEMHRQIALLQQKAAALEAEIVRRKRAEQDLRCREQELSDFLENAVEGLHKVGADGRVLWANQAELDMLGYEPDQYIGHHIAEFHVDRESIADMLARLGRGEALYDYPARLRARDGSIRHVLVHSNALFEDGELVHTRCFTRDVTERVRLEAELQKKLEELAEADRRKSNFLAVLGHELRNPLAAIVTRVELMRLREDPAYLARSREIVARQAALMTRLVDDLLDISRINQGRIQLRTEEVLLDTIIERAVELARSLIDERRHRLTVELPEEPVRLLGDTARLVQIVANLLNNAAKYTNAGGNIWLTARKVNHELLLCVRDDGIGLSEELCERIFEPFVQAQDSLERSRGGLGIGLTLVRNLVDLHGGRIIARSDGPGHGSEFEICLPLPLATDP